MAYQQYAPPPVPSDSHRCFLDVGSNPAEIVQHALRFPFSCFTSGQPPDNPNEYTRLLATKQRTAAQC